MPFSSPIRTEWSDDGKTMTLIDEVAFTDRAGREWKVSAGFKTDGASIPQFLWSIVGSPFTGKYRNAALFHDAAYATLGVTKNDADGMFYEAMLESGCDQALASLILSGVRFGGFEPYAAAQRRAAAN